MPAADDMQTPLGYALWSQKDRFEHINGPIFIHAQRAPASGQGLVKFFSQKKHLNRGGAVHGGMLMTFADTAMFAIALPALDGARAVTVTMNNEFVSAGWPDQWIEAEGELVRQTKSGLLFVRGKVFSADTVILTFSGLLKKIERRP